VITFGTIDGKTWWTDEGEFFGVNGEIYGEVKCWPAHFNKSERHWLVNRNQIVWRRVDA
jgi:hypothetical protein